MAEPAKKLTDVGTRFNHLCDLQDIWGDGLQAVTNSMKKFATPKDHKRKAQLEGAIELLETYMTKLADYDNKQQALRKEVGSIPLNKWRDADAKNSTVGTKGMESKEASSREKQEPERGDGEFDGDEATCA